MVSEFEKNGSHLYSLTRQTHTPRDFYCNHNLHLTLFLLWHQFEHVTPNGGGWSYSRSCNDLGSVFFKVSFSFPGDIITGNQGGDGHFARTDLTGEYMCNGGRCQMTCCNPVSRNYISMQPNCKSKYNLSET